MQEVYSVIDWFDAAEVIPNKDFTTWIGGKEIKYSTPILAYCEIPKLGAHITTARVVFDGEEKPEIEVFPMFNDKLSIDYLKYWSPMPIDMEFDEK